MTEDGFWRITLDTNPDFCNLACVMCEDHSPHVDRDARRRAGRLRPMMPLAMMEAAIIDAAAMGIREVIPSTMGEPLLYPHFPRMVELCGKLGLKLNLTTNGTFPGPSGRDNATIWAERVLPVASDVKISWNGAQATTQAAIMIGAQLGEHIANARRFILVRDAMPGPERPTITMQLTFMRRNLDEIPEMVRLAAELGFDRVKGHQLWAHFGEIADEDLRASVQSAARWNVVVEACHAIVAAHEAAGGRPLRLDNFHPLDTKAPRQAIGDCPFLGREAWVDPRGRFNVCCAPDAQRQSLGDFGTLLDAPLSELVRSEAYAALLATWREKPLCQGCSMRRPNG